MHTTRISSLRNRRGISTILGVIIFVGLLFSTVVPMYLVMNQADTVYDKKVYEMDRLDDERSREKLYISAYPNYLNESEMKLKIRNRCDLNVRIVRLWVNDECQTKDEVVESMMDEEIGPFPVTLLNGTYYDVKVTTERGNIFTSQTGSLYYYDGVWWTPELSVSISILNTQGQYYLKVENETSHWFDDWESDGIIHDDFVKTFEVLEPGIYKVTMQKKVSGNWKELAASPVYVTIEWPYGPPIAFVYGEGNKLK